MYRVNLILAFAILLAGCQQLLNGQTQPVVIKNGNYFTSCGGAVETWGSCNNKAMNICKNGYTTVSKEENVTGTKRELTFVCNK